MAAPPGLGLSIGRPAERYVNENENEENEEQAAINRAYAERMRALHAQQAAAAAAAAAREEKEEEIWELNLNSNNFKPQVGETELSGNVSWANKPANKAARAAAAAAETGAVAAATSQTLNPLSNAKPVQTGPAPALSHPRRRRRKTRANRKGSRRNRRRRTQRKSRQYK